MTSGVSRRGSTDLISYRIADLDAAVLFERVPSAKNIAPIPTKLKHMPPPPRHVESCKCLGMAIGLISTAMVDFAAGRPTQPLRNNPVVLISHPL